MKALDLNMERLNDEVLLREQRLKDALDAQKYYRSAEEVEFWMSTTDAKLASREPGKVLELSPLSLSPAKVAQLH